MRLIWHIFTKDAQSLWRQAMLPLLLLAWLGLCDAGRTGATPGHLEGWLHLLVPLAWSFLIGSVVLEDAPIGEAAAWMTLPVAWQRLLAAKILFALLFVHLPLLAAQSFILGARGFEPWLGLPQLATAQVGLLLMLTVPSLALGSVVSNLAQFAACAFPLVALLVFLGGPLKFTSWGDQHRIEVGFCVSIVAAAAAWMVFCQYRRRYAPWWVRATGLGAVSAAAMLYMWFPRPLAARLKETLSPSAAATMSLSLRLAPASQPPPAYLLRPGSALTVAIPVAATGWPADSFATIGPISLELETATGEHIQAEWPSPNRPFASIRLEGYLATMPDSNMPAWQILHLEPELYSRLRTGPVKLRARVLVDLLRPLKPSLLRSQVRTSVPGVGTCGTAVLAGYLGGHHMLRVACESPAPIPFGSRIRPVHEGSSRQRAEYFGGATTYSPHPQAAWLSPLHRRDAFIHFQDADRLPIRSSPIEVLPFVPEGAHILSYELANLTLDAFAMSPLP